MTGFDVEPDELGRRAAQVDEVAARLDDAVGAMSSTAAPDAFGLLCSFFPALLAPAQQSARAVLADGAASVRSTADVVRASARDYGQGDDAIATSLRGAGPGPVAEPGPGAGPGAGAGAGAPPEARGP